MVAASRSHRPVTARLQTYLSVLLDSVDSLDDMTEFAVPFIAGCLVIDNYAYDVPSQYPVQTNSFNMLTKTSSRPAQGILGSLQARLSGRSCEQNPRVSETPG
jgi:hypothetical protein